MSARYILLVTYIRVAEVASRRGAGTTTESSIGQYTAVLKKDIYFHFRSIPIRYNKVYQLFCFTISIYYVTDWLTLVLRAYWRHRYENSIAGQYFGHSHTDWYEVFYDDVTFKRPTSVLYIPGSVTTFAYLNPGFRIYENDGMYKNTTWVNFFWYIHWSA
jgi:hypothetical protein